MGANAPPIRAACGVRNRITNPELRITGARQLLSRFVLLCALCAFAGNSFAQSEEGFAVVIERGTTEQKRDALAQIRNLKSETFSRIAVPALRDKAEIVRATAAFSVVFLPEDEALNALLPLLADKKELVRREAAYALGAVGSPQAAGALLEILRRDKVLEVRTAAVVALGAIGDASAVPELVRILQRKPIEKEEFLRRSAARSMGRIAEIVQGGKRAAQTPESFDDEYIFIAAPKYADLIEAFPVFRSANETLIEILRNSREAADVKREAAFALGAVGDAAAVGVLQSATNAEDYYLAEISREALRKIDVLTKIRKANQTAPNPR